MTDQMISGYGDAPGRFRIGDVLSRALSTWTRKLAPLLLIYIACSLPALLISQLFGTGSTPGHVDPGQGLATLLSGILNLFLLSLAQAAIVIIAFQTMRERPVTLGEALSQATNRLLPMIGASICLGLAVVLGTLLLVVPGVMLAVRYYIYAAACVIEEQGPIDSLGRSAELTRGYRWPIFGLILILWIPIVFLSAAVGALGFGLFGPLIGEIILELWSAVLGSLNATLLAAIYHDLRLAKEGGDVDKIARVFD